MGAARSATVFPLRIAWLILSAASWGQEAVEPSVPRQIPPQPEQVRWERFGRILEGQEAVGTFLYSADIPLDDHGEPMATGPRASRLLLEVATSEKPSSVLRLAFFQQDVPAGTEDKESQLLVVTGDPESGQWLAWRRRTSVAAEKGGDGGHSFVLFETASWRSSWISEASGDEEKREMESAKELIPELLDKLRRVRDLLPNENKAFPDYFRVFLGRVAGACGWPESPGVPSRRYQVLDKRVARGEAREKPLAADFERRFGSWSRWDRLPARLRLLF